ncbi:MAG: hypothetical protein ACPL3P_08145 [Anaerolineales bacterium]
MLIRQIQSVEIHPAPTAHLTTTMSLLELGITELHENIVSELASNPALEHIEGRFCPNCQRPLPENNQCPICSRPKITPSTEPIVYVSPRDDFHSVGYEYEEMENEFEDYTAETQDLPTYVLQQIASELEVEDRPIAAHILTSLDEDGLLRTPLIEFAAFHHVPSHRIEKVQKIIQYADPIGVGSSTPQQALLIQLEVLSQTNEVPQLARQAIQEGWNFLVHQQYTELSRLLGISVSQTKEIAKFVHDNLNPYPARANWGEQRQPTTPYNGAYYHPDVIISLLNQDDENSPLVVEVISPVSGILRVNPLFREGIKDADPNKVEQWQTDLNKATLLVKCLQQRNHAIVMLMEKIATIQRDYILKGDAYLKPLTRAQLAREIQVHESTISRSVARKTVQLPSGKIIPISKFFDRSLQVRAELQRIIESEKRPLTDMELVARLQELGYQVARRTVAKYRSMDGIMPSHGRKKTKDRKPIYQSA